MFNIAVELFFDEVDETRLVQLNKLFIDSIESATSVVRIPLPFTSLRKGLKARKELLKYFESKAESIDTEQNTLFSELVKTNDQEGGLSYFEIAEHMIFLLLAAHDTTTSTLTSSIHYLSTDAIEDSINVEAPNMEDNETGFFVVDEEACTRCALCVDRCPTGVISLGKFAGSLADAAIKNGVYESPWDEDSGERSDRHGYIYGRL